MTRHVRLAAALAMLASLGACVWGGPALYTEDQAATPVTPGRYRAIVDNDPTDGMVSIAGKVTFVALAGQPPVRILLIPLSLAARRLWIIQAPTGPDGRDFAYGLLEPGANGWTVEPYIVCAGTEATVLGAGGRVEKGPAPRSAGDMGPDDRACVFTSRRSLETALRSWAASHPLAGKLSPAG